VIRGQQDKATLCWQAATDHGPRTN
jgi:hypothetical protein